MSKEKLLISFDESLSDSSIRMIKNILSDSLGFKTEIERQECQDDEEETTEPDAYPHLADMKDFDYDGWME